MDIKEKDLQELQEKLVLLYKFIKQEKLYERYYFKDSDFTRPYKYKNKLINQLLELEDSQEFLKTCIMELEELKEGDGEISFLEILDKQDMQSLLIKYGMKNYDDVDHMDLEIFLKYF